MPPAERVDFTSDRIQLVGHLRRPPGDGPHPAMVFTGPFTGVKEQVTGHYAQHLTDEGFVTLAFDHRNFGESDGTPRQHEDATGKLHDLRDAVSFLAARPEVDAQRITCCGICLGGSYALKFSAFDPRISAVALVAGGYNDPRAMREGMGADGYRDQLRHFAAVTQREYETGEVEYLAAVDPEGGAAAMPGRGPWDYYGTDRSASPHWENRVTALSIRELITLDAASAAAFLSPTPMLMVHGRTDAYCSPEGAQSTFDLADNPKRLVWLGTSNHIDLYDNEAYVAPAVAAIKGWLDTHLAG